MADRGRAPTVMVRRRRGRGRGEAVRLDPQFDIRTWVAERGETSILLETIPDQHYVLLSVGTSVIERAAVGDWVVAEEGLTVHTPADFGSLFEVI